VGLRETDVGPGLVVSSRRLGSREWLVVQSMDDRGVFARCDGVAGGDHLVVPIVLVTANAEERERVVLELTRHIRSVLGRAPAPTVLPPRVIQVGELRIETDAHRVTVDDAEVPLSFLEFKLLVTLADRRDRVQTRGVLLRDVWSVLDPPVDRRVDLLVKRLRDKLGTAARFIRTVFGLGYCFRDGASTSRPRRPSGSRMSTLAQEPPTAIV
jgi:DNA-binding winged helix-turn-helix (wHTH) protein